ncbi:hypothetical protein IJD34_01765 [bacterium]|nr:hypothetical protein [bacterium]
MLVSAMTASNAQFANFSNTNGCVNTKGFEDQVSIETNKNTFANEQKKYVSSTKSFNDIFEWHNFCNCQIEKGKLDIIA